MFAVYVCLCLESKPGSDDTKPGCDELPLFVPPDEYADAVRLRLGTGFTAEGDEPVPCAACDDGAVWPTCGHALCCAPGACTRGHNDATKALLDLACLADPATRLEPLGVVPSVQNARPAYVLSTAALPGCTAALDLGIASPDAVGAVSYTHLTLPTILLV